MNIVCKSSLDDFSGWLFLAKEAEPLFGPMTDDPSFIDGLKEAILNGKSFCVRDQGGNSQSSLHGGIVISSEKNEILWFAVKEKSRGKGIGKSLLSEAIKHLKSNDPITVTTFDESSEEGRPARRLYHQFGFQDSGKAGLNPAGIPIVLMIRKIRNLEQTS